MHYFRAVIVCAFSYISSSFLHISAQTQEHGDQSHNGPVWITAGQPESRGCELSWPEAAKEKVKEKVYKVHEDKR